MEIKPIKKAFTVCKIDDIANVDFHDEFCFIGKTDEELSLVCSTDCIPVQTLAREDGWRGFRIQGVLDFSLVGILSKISAILAENQIGIFAISTYNTDYIFTKEVNFQAALTALEANGYSISKSV